MTRPALELISTLIERRLRNFRDGDAAGQGGGLRRRITEETGQHSHGGTKERRRTEGRHGQ
jgi:hypothetical protein